MKRLVRFPLESGADILVEVEPPEGRAAVTRRGGVVDDVAERARESFEAGLDKVKPAAIAIVERLGSLSNPPHTLSVEFGIKLSAEAGVFIAAASTEATFKVTLTWSGAAKSGG